MTSCHGHRPDALERLSHRQGWFGHGSLRSPLWGFAPDPGAGAPRPRRRVAGGQTQYAITSVSSIATALAAGGAHIWCPRSRTDRRLGVIRQAQTVVNRLGLSHHPGARHIGAPERREQNLFDGRVCPHDYEVASQSSRELARGSPRRAGARLVKSFDRWRRVRSGWRGACSRDA